MITQQKCIHHKSSVQTGIQLGTKCMACRTYELVSLLAQSSAQLRCQHIFWACSRIGPTHCSFPIASARGPVGRAASSGAPPCRAPQILQICHLPTVRIWLVV